MLTLSHNYSSVTEKALAKIKRLSPEPPGSPGRLYRPVPHLDLIDAVKQGAYRCGFEEDKDSVRVNVCNKQMDVVFGFRLSGHKAREMSSKGYVPAVGVVHSNGRRRALTFYAGLQNGKGVGVVMIKTTIPKQPSQMLDANESVLFMQDAACEMLFADRVWEEVTGLHRQMKKLRVTNEGRSLRLHDAAKNGYLPWSMMRRAEDALDRRTSSTGDESAWTLLKAFGAANTQSPPIKQLDRAYGFFNLVRLRGGDRNVLPAA